MANQLSLHQQILAENQHLNHFQKLAQTILHSVDYIVNLQQDKSSQYFIKNS